MPEAVALIAGGDNDTTGVRLMQLSCGGFKVELMQPLHDDSLVAKRLARHGPGFHHLTFFVDDLVQTVDDLAAAGVATIGTNPASPHWRGRPPGHARTCAT